MLHNAAVQVYLEQAEPDYAPNPVTSGANQTGVQGLGFRAKNQ